ncbi:MAG: DUF4118 domain-containing protein [Capsulimonadaceae bacterium]
MAVVEMEVARVLPVTHGDKPDVRGLTAVVGRFSPPASYGWAAARVGAATCLLWLARHAVDKGQAAMLYLPVVLSCSLRLGFGPAVFGAVLSFLCLDFFFLRPYYSFSVSNPKDLISLFVFLAVALTTTRLASQVERRSAEAQAREAELTTLNRASETVSREVVDDLLLAALGAQIIETCHAGRCLIYRRGPTGLTLMAGHSSPEDRFDPEMIVAVGEEALQFDQVVGFGKSMDLWAKAVAMVDTASRGAGELGAYVPLRAQEELVGLLHVGPREDGARYSAAEERLILTLANHAAVVIARQALAARAAQVEVLREADMLKDALLSLVSHELRSPLAAIKASASGLMQPGGEWDSGARMEAVAAIDREADRLAGLVSNLLDLSRLEAGAWLPNKDWCDVADVVGAVLGRFRSEPADRVRVTVEAGVPLIRADYTQVALVVSNLLDNALKYSNGPIDVRLAPDFNGQDEDPCGMTLTVRDYGEGLAPGDEERLFTRFYRSARHASSAVHGTGLGLALCHAIVVAHEGVIEAANAVEPPGAIFAVRLPVG